MANKRMFSLEIVDTDKFMGLSLSAQALYFHLGMRADDDGFVSVAKKIMFFIGCSQKELQQLVDNGLVIPFESGIVVITDWKKQNYIQKDRYKPTVYTEERGCLELKNNKYYLKDLLENAQVAVQNGAKTSMDTECIQDVSSLDTQYRLGKDSIGKNNNIYSANFELFWKTYPRKKEKSKANKAYNARLKDGYSEEELLKAATAYAEECKNRKTEERFIKLAATFLSANTPFVDYLKVGEEVASEDRGQASDFYREFLRSRGSNQNS